MKEKLWKTEAEMVTAFRESRHVAGWKCYAETCGWDLLLVRESDGFQIGIDAKLSLNAEVVLQCLQHRAGYRDVGPDCSAVLVPRNEIRSGMDEIANHLLIRVIAGFKNHRNLIQFNPELLTEDSYSLASGWVDLCPEKRHPLPDYVPDVSGGVPSPLRLTKWKIQAIKAAILLKLFGSISRKEIRALGMDPRRWVEEWLLPDGNGRFKPGPKLPAFHAQHPVNFAEIEADLEKWDPRDRFVLQP